MLLNRTDEIHESTEGHFILDAYDPQSHSNPKRLGCGLLGDHSSKLDAPLRPVLYDARPARCCGGEGGVMCPPTFIRLRLEPRHCCCAWARLKQGAA